MGGRSDSGDEECEEDKRKECALRYWCWWWLKVVGSNKNNNYANAIMTASYQVLADFRVIKYVYVLGPVPGGGFWHRTDVGQYVYFPSETRWLFVNRISIEADDAVDPQCSLTSSSSTIVLRYCAHRSHTPTENFAEVLHREPIRENWPKLLAALKELQKRQIQKHACVAAVGVASASTFPNIGVGNGATSSACRKRPYVQSSAATAVVE